MFLSAKHAPQVLESASVVGNSDEQYIQPQQELLPSEETEGDDSLKEIECLLNDIPKSPATASSETDRLAFQYFAGFVCRNTAQNERNAEEKDLPNNLWIKLRDLGGLYYPEQTYLDILKEFEVCFYAIHGNEVSLKTNVIKDFIALLESKYSNIERPFIVKYSRSRLFIRIRELRKRELKVKPRTQTSRGQIKKKQLSK